MTVVSPTCRLPDGVDARHLADVALKDVAHEVSCRFLTVFDSGCHGRSPFAFIWQTLANGARQSLAHLVASRNYATTPGESTALPEPAKQDCDFHLPLDERRHSLTTSCRWQRADLLKQGFAKMTQCISHVTQDGEDPAGGTASAMLRPSVAVRFQRSTSIIHRTPPWH